MEVPIFSAAGSSIANGAPQDIERTATQVQLYVQDTGSGIAAEQLGQIFEPLYTTKPGGTGLGLYIVQEIMPAHGGKIAVQSATGQVTTFTLTFPCLSAIPAYSLVPSVSHVSHMVCEGIDQSFCLDTYRIALKRRGR